MNKFFLVFIASVMLWAGNAHARSCLYASEFESEASIQTPEQCAENFFRRAQKGGYTGGAVVGSTIFFRNEETHAVVVRCTTKEAFIIFGSIHRKGVLPDECQKMIQDLADTVLAERAKEHSTPLSPPKTN